MGVLLAQEFQIVRSEINDQQAAARPQHARGFANGAGAVVEEVEHLMNNDDVEGIARQRQVVDIAVTHAAMFEAGAIEPLAGERQHVERQIEADAALDLGREEFEHAAGAGAEIEQRADRLVGKRRADRFLYGGIGDVQLADAVPFRGVAAEIGLRGGGAGAAHGRQPFAVAGDGRVVGVEPGDEGAGDVGRAAVFAQAEKCPRPFAEALDQPGLGQKPQMARQPRLRLAQDFGEVGNGEFGLRQQRQNAQARAFRGRFEGRGQRRKAELAVSLMSRHKDIFIRLSELGNGQDGTYPNYRGTPGGSEDGMPGAALGGAGHAMRTCRHGRGRQKQRFTSEAAAGGAPYGLREGETAVELPERFDASLYFIGRIHTPWRERDECPKNARQVGRGLHDRASIHDGRKGSAAWRPRATSSCFIGWIRRGATSWCSRLATTRSETARSRCAHRRGPIPSRCRWRGLSASKATRSRWSDSIASTTRRCSTSSRISRRRIRCPTLMSAGTPTASSKLSKTAAVSSRRGSSPDKPNRRKSAAAISWRAFCRSLSAGPSS